MSNEDPKVKIKELETKIGDQQKEIEGLNSVIEKQIKEIGDLKIQLKGKPSAREAIIAKCKKSGKGIYCLEPFMNNKRKYNPGEKINPDNLVSIEVKKLIAKELVIEVK